MKPILYLGERIGLSGPYQLFRDAKGTPFHFRGIKGVYFGGAYQMLREGKLHIRPKTAESSKLTPTPQERTEFEASKIAVKAWRLEQRKALEIKKPHPDIIRAIELLKPFYRSLDRFEGARFIRWVENQCSKRPSKKRK